MASYKHYYFIPQLSSLVYGQPPPVSPAAFLEQAAAMLDEGDAALLRMVSLDPRGQDPAGAKACAFLDGWRGWDREMRMCLAALRAARLGRAADGDAQERAPFGAAVSAAAAKAMGAENPLEGEAAVDRARWDAAEALQGSELFHVNTVLGYMLKLLILERQASFQAETGFAQYKLLYGSILERSGAAAGGGPAMGEPK